VVASESGEAGNPGRLGMTILFGNAKYGFQDELSSRPERSAVEGSAVRLPVSAQCLAAITNSVPGEIL
jgi:hypothetical protein